MAKTERRAEERIRVAFQVLRAVPPIEGVAFLVDASAGGCRLVGTDAQPGEGYAVELTVRLPERTSPLELRGTIARHTENGFAVTFEKPVPEFAALTGADPTALAAEDVRPVAAPATPAPTQAPRGGLAPYQEVAVSCCANMQWTTGRICMPTSHTLIDHLGQAGAFLRVVDVTTPHEPAPMSFVAMRSEALDLVIPYAGQDNIRPPKRVGNYVRRDVRVLLPYAAIDGSIEVLERIRLSDHVLRCGDFLALDGGRIRLARGQQLPPEVGERPTILVNMRRVLGISDLAAAPAPETEAG